LLHETVHVDLFITYLNRLLLCFSKYLPQKAEVVSGVHLFFWKICISVAQANSFIRRRIPMRLLQWYHDNYQVKSLMTGRMETLHPLLKRVEKRTLGTTDFSASSPCPGRSWNTSS